MRVLKNIPFSRFAADQRIADRALCLVVERAERGLIDADLGRGLVKARIARQGQGKSGGYRTVMVFRSERMAIFVYGFPKNQRSNLTVVELRAFRRLADELLGLSDEDIDVAVRGGVLIEVECEEHEDE